MELRVRVRVRVEKLAASVDEQQSATRMAAQSTT